MCRTSRGPRCRSASCGWAACAHPAPPPAPKRGTSRPPPRGTLRAGWCRASSGPRRSCVGRRRCRTGSSRAARSIASLGGASSSRGPAGLRSLRARAGRRPRLSSSRTCSARRPPASSRAATAMSFTARASRTAGLPATRGRRCTRRSSRPRGWRTTPSSGWPSRTRRGGSPRHWRGTSRRRASSRRSESLPAPSHSDARAAWRSTAAPSPTWGARTPCRSEARASRCPWWGAASLRSREGRSSWGTSTTSGPSRPARSGWTLGFASWTTPSGQPRSS
mmetsp:Transcript_47937/g.155488  ORF Transcript_47937/g.155488 Transcript_47937/m.155488 type:complete len:278 (-) Transcript_47937:724-1557(-)